jgi:hypothetical protein
MNKILKLEAEKNIDGLALLLNSNDIFIKMNAIDALMRLGNPKAVSSIQKCLNDSAIPVKERAIDALGVFKVSESISYLFYTFNKENSESIKKRILKSISLIGGLEATYALQKMITNNNHNIQNAINEAILQIGDHSNVEIGSDIKEKFQIIEENIQNENTIVEKGRHVFVTTWLILMIIFNSISAFIGIVASTGDGSAQELLPLHRAPDVIFLILGICSLVNVAFVVLLLKKKIIGFWGCAISAIVATFINLNYNQNTGSALLGLVGIFLLYSILQIKKENVSAWKGLK